MPTSSATGRKGQNITILNEQTFQIGEFVVLVRRQDEAGVEKPHQVHIEVTVDEIIKRQITSYPVGAIGNRDEEYFHFDEGKAEMFIITFQRFKGKLAKAFARKEKKRLVQVVPTHAELIAAGAEETGDDNGCYSIESPAGRVYTYIPDKDGQGWMLEPLIGGGGNLRPASLDEAEALMAEQDGDTDND